MTSPAPPRDGQPSCPAATGYSDPATARNACQLHAHGAHHCARHPGAHYRHMCLCAHEWLSLPVDEFTDQALNDLMHSARHAA